MPSISIQYTELIKLINIKYHIANMGHLPVLIRVITILISFLNRRQTCLYKLLISLQSLYQQFFVSKSKQYYIFSVQNPHQFFFKATDCVYHFV